MRGFISKKEGIGRRYLYVLTRRVGPAFSLDVSAYSGYLSLEPLAIEEVMRQGGEVGRAATDERQTKLPFGSIGSDGEWVISDPTAETHGEPDERKRVDRGGILRDKVNVLGA